MTFQSMVCTKCATDTESGPIHHRDIEGVAHRLFGLCYFDATGEGVIVDCVECGKKKHVDFESKTQERLISNSTCFNCDYWRDYGNKKDDPSSVRVNGNHYWIAAVGFGRGRDDWKGFGGQRFVIEFFDGRRVETDDLWSQGDIPPHFRERLPDNARFGKVA